MRCLWPIFPRCFWVWKESVWGKPRSRWHSELAKIQRAAQELVTSNVQCLQTHAPVLLLHGFFKNCYQILCAPVRSCLGTEGKDFQVAHTCSEKPQWHHYATYMVITFRWKKTLSSSAFKFPKYALSVYSIFASTQYSCCLTACLSWQKIELELFKILSEIIKNRIQVTTQEMFWNSVVPRRRKKKKRKKEWSLPHVQDSKDDNKNLLCLVFSHFWDSLVYILPFNVATKQEVPVSSTVM